MDEASTLRRRRSGVGVHVGRIGGVDLDLDYSWFVLFFLILATFTGVVFPGYVPGLGRGTYLAMGAAGTLLFFLSLLAHELAHAFVALRKGIGVEGITLFIFGGMARTRSEASTPGDEFQIAGVGPVMSLALALAFQGVAVAAGGPETRPAVWAVAVHLAVLNLALALFNLLPGFPLDGGRLLRSLVWRVTGDLRRATRVATAAGRWLGWGVMALGAWVLLVGGQAVGGLWFIFIGWFLAQAAAASYEQLLLRIVLRDRVARDAMTQAPETVGPELKLDRLVHDYFMKRPYNSFPVTDDGIVIGLVTLSQVKRVPDGAWPETSVADVMTPLVDTLIVSPTSPMTEVLERMGENETRRVIVAQEWELRGIITGGDIANWLDRASLVR
ncbi:MAG: site-2 protease family protein [Gemmatimonadota bacterium]|jgi:Zn-dependent protease/predicted transcriptional regulator